MAGALCSRNWVFLQQAVFFVAAMVTAALAARARHRRRLAARRRGLGRGRRLVRLARRGRRVAVLAQGAASVGAIVAAMTTFPADAGMVLALATAVTVIGLGVWFRDLVMVGIGSLGLLQLLPMVLSEWFPDTVAAPFVLLGVGVLVLGTAVWTAMRGRGTGRTAAS